jgi:hypothetical protein
LAICFNLLDGSLKRQQKGCHQRVSSDSWCGPGQELGEELTTQMHEGTLRVIKTFHITIVVVVTDCMHLPNFLCQDTQNR